MLRSLQREVLIGSCSSCLRTEGPARLRGAEVALVGLAAVWGLTFVMVKDAVELFPATTFLAYRFIPAAGIVSIVFRNQLRRLTPAGWRAALLMGLFLTGGYVFQTLGLERTTASNAGFITGLYVVLTPLFGVLFLRKRPRRVVWIAAMLSVTGLLLLSGGGNEAHLAGDALVLLCACSFALHILATGSAAQQHDAGALLAVQLSATGLLTFFIAALAGELKVPRSPHVWSALLVTSLIASALGFFVQTYAQRHIPADRTAVILAAEPAFAGLFAYLLAGETLSTLDWVGAALIIISILTVEAVPHLRPVRPLPER